MKRIAKLFFFLTLICLIACIFVACDDGVTPETTTYQPGENPGGNQEDDSIDGHNHSFGDWVILTAASCTEKGLKKHTCLCGKEETEEINELGHHYESVVTEPTCNERGYTTHTCSRCGDYYIDTYTETIEHSYGGDGVCVRCGATQSGSIGLVFTELDDGTYQVSNYTGTSKSIVIPSSYNDCPVTKIKPFAFSGAEITSVFIPSSVSSIGNGAFFECAHLESITIPFVGAKARLSVDAEQYPLGYLFGEMNYEGSVEVEQIYGGEEIHYYLPSTLRSVTVTGGELRDNVFLNCSTLTSIVISGAISDVGANAFKGCSELISISLPDTIVSIGSDAFLGCVKMNSVHYDGDIATWLSIDFSDEDSNPIVYARNLFVAERLVTEIDIPSSITEISAYTFSGLRNVEEIIIPRGVSTIGASALRNCADLISVQFEENGSLKSIGSRAFANCAKIKTMSLPSSVTNVGFAAFSGDTSLESLELPFVGALRNGSTNTHMGYIFGASTYANSANVIPQSLKVIVIQEGVEALGDYAFYGCTDLTEIRIPQSLTQIGNSAFYGCNHLSTVTIPNGVTSIPDYSFYNCTSLTSVIIPDSVNRIWSNTFSNCPIETATIPAIACSRINNSALRSVTITSGTSIGEDAFV